MDLFEGIILCDFLVKLTYPYSTKLLFFHMHRRKNI